MTERVLDKCCIIILALCLVCMTFAKPSMNLTIIPVAVPMPAPGADPFDGGLAPPLPWDAVEETTVIFPAARRFFQ